jgi:multidrug efflux pump subunit AcrB
MPTPVPLSAFTHFEMKPSPLTISHQGQFPVVTVSFNVAEGSSLGQAVDAVKRGKRTSYAGQRDRRLSGNRRRLHGHRRQ